MRASACECSVYASDLQQRVLAVRAYVCWQAAKKTWNKKTKHLKVYYTIPTSDTPKRNNHKHRLNTQNKTATVKRLNLYQIENQVDSSDEQDAKRNKNRGTNQNTSIKVEHVDFQRCFIDTTFVLCRSISIQTGDCYCRNGKLLLVFCAVSVLF